MGELGEKGAVRPVEGGPVPCTSWDLKYDPVLLPLLPRDLPELPGSDSHDNEETKLVKIAAGEDFVIGLTNKGHVLKIDVPTARQDQDEIALQEKFKQKHIQWQYLPLFSEVEKVKSNPAFSSTNSDKQIDPLTDMYITHISAHFQTFMAYSTGSSSIVLIGSISTDPLASPQILPELQHRDIISVVLGDYHFGALTSSGDLYTWGSYSLGALGLGDPKDLEPGEPGGFATLQDKNRAVDGPRHTTSAEPPKVSVPTKVRFDWEDGVKDRFVVAATASGWHFGALVLDLTEHPETEEKNKGKEPDEDSGSQIKLPRGETSRLPQIGIPRPVRGHLPFRVGYAGRGVFRGRGMGRGFGSEGPSTDS